MTAAALIAQMPPRTYASRAGFRSAVRRWIVRKTGRQPVAATEDAAGNCLVCGESGRCPGWHTAEEATAADWKREDCL